MLEAHVYGSLSSTTRQVSFRKVLQPTVKTQSSMKVGRGLMRTAAIGAVLVVCTSTSVFAAPVQADFRAELSIPDVRDGTRVFERLSDPVSNAPNLNLSDEVANPAFLAGFATIDLNSSGVVTLTGDQSEAGFADYDLAVFTISNIVFDAGETITGVTELTSGLLDPDFEFGEVSPIIAFTENSLTITFDTTGVGAGSDFEFLDGGSSTFQIETEAAVVPVPAALPLLVFGLAGFGLLTRSSAVA